MKHIKRYEKFFEKRVSYFDTKGWENLLPKELSIVTDNGRWTLERKDFDHSMGHATNVSNILNCVQLDYYQNTLAEKGGDVTADGEPDHLCIDITLVKDNDGTDQNPDSLRLNVDITYGDAMVAEFTIDKPNKIEVYHYTGIGSKHDPDTFFGFEDDSLESLVRFFNSWGYSIDKGHLSFIDEHPDTYTPE